MVSRSSSLRRLVQHFFSVASQPRRGDCDITVKCTCIYFVSRQPSLDFMRVRVEGACQIEMKFACTSSQSHCESLILRCSSCIAYSIYIYTYKVIYIHKVIYIYIYIFILVYTYFLHCFWTRCLSYLLMLRLLLRCLSFIAPFAGWSFVF